MVREFAREDERRVMLVLRSVRRAASAALCTGETDPKSSAAEHAERFERAVTNGGVHRLAFQPAELRAAIPHRPVFHAYGAGRSEIIYDALRELATVQPRNFVGRRRVSRRAGVRARNLQNHRDGAPASLDSLGAVVILLFHFHRSAVNQLHVFMRN